MPRGDFVKRRGFFFQGETDERGHGGTQPVWQRNAAGATLRQCAAGAFPKRRGCFFQGALTRSKDDKFLIRLLLVLNSMFRELDSGFR